MVGIFDLNVIFLVNVVGVEIGSKISRLATQVVLEPGKFTVLADVFHVNTFVCVAMEWKDEI